MSPHKIWNIRIFFLATALLGSVLLFSLERSSAVFAQSEAVFIRQIRAFDRDNVGDLDPVGLAFSPEAETFLVVEAGTITHSSRVVTNVTMITALEERIGSVPIEANIFDAINVAFDSRFGRLLLIDSANNELIEIKAGPDGTVDSSTLIRHDARHFGIAIAQGMTVDPASGHLFIVDSSGPQIVRVEPGLDGGFDQAAVSIMDLKSTGLEEVRGIAFDPDSGHLHLYSPRDQELVELTQSGQFVAGRDMSGFDLQMPQAMVFAPSGDQTDDPAQVSLYVADSGLVSTGAQTFGTAADLTQLAFQCGPIIHQ